WDRISFFLSQCSSAMGSKKSWHAPSNAVGPDQQQRPLRTGQFALGDQKRTATKYAEAEVWDILNSGPRQRFTANGRLVHNCLVLDHSNTHRELGFVTDIHHEILDDGKPREKSEATEPVKYRKCPACTHLNHPQAMECAECGFE